LTYHATADSGPNPSLAGPALTVTTGASPTPDGRPGDEEPAPTSTGGADVDDPSPGPVDAPTAAPNAPGRPRPDSRTPVPAPGNGNGNRGGSSASEEPKPEQRSADPGSRKGRRNGQAAPTGHRPGVPAADDAPLADDPAGTPRGDLLMLLAGIVTVATVALLGTGWMLASREREDEVAGGAAGETGDPPGPRGTRRVRGAAGVHPAHDPVLAALGLDDPADGSHRPLRGAARGAAPRPRKAPRAPR
jgi:hypothetical protein